MGRACFGKPGQKRLCQRHHKLCSKSTLRREGIDQQCHQPAHVGIGPPVQGLGKRRAQPACPLTAQKRGRQRDDMAARAGPEIIAMDGMRRDEEEIAR